MSISYRHHLKSWIRKQQFQHVQQYETAIVDGSIREYSQYTEDVDSQRSHSYKLSGKSRSGGSHRSYQAINNKDVVKDFSNVGIFHPSKLIFRWAILLLTSNLLLIAYFGDEAIPATVPLLKAKYNLNSQQIAVLYSASFIPNLVMTVLGGILIDKYGTNKTSLLFSTFILFGMGIFSFSPSYYGMLVGRVVFGLGFESLEVAGDARLTRWFWDESLNKSPSLSFSYSMVFAASQMGQLLGSNILPTIGEKSLFWCYTVITIVCFVGLLSNIVLVVMDTSAAPILGLDNVDDEEEFSLHALKQLPKQYWLLCLITVLTYTVILVVMAFALDILHEHYKLEPDVAGHMNSAVYGLSIIFSPIVGYALNRYGRLLVVLNIGILCLGSNFIGFFHLGWGENLAVPSTLLAGLILLGLGVIQPYIALVLIGLSYALIPNSIWPCVYLVAGDAVVGSAFGGVTGLNSLGLMVLPYIMGYIFDTYKTYAYVCYAAAGLAALGWLLCLVISLLDFLDNGWLNAGRPNPHADVEESTDKLPLLKSNSTRSKQ